VLGLCYDTGDGVTQDKARGFELTRRSAEQGHTQVDSVCC
jgi:TPR repeat protein